MARMLAALFPHDPQFEGRRVVTFHNQRDYIFFRHHRLVLPFPFYSTLSHMHQHNIPHTCTYTHITSVHTPCVCRYIFKNAQRVGLQEIGPRFTLKLRSLQKGTFDSRYGQYMWVHKASTLTPYPEDVLYYLSMHNFFFLMT